MCNSVCGAPLRRPGPRACTRLPRGAAGLVLTDLWHALRRVCYAYLLCIPANVPRAGSRAVRNSAVEPRNSFSVDLYEYGAMKSAQDVALWPCLTAVTMVDEMGDDTWAMRRRLARPLSPHTLQHIWTGAMPRHLHQYRVATRFGAGDYAQSSVLFKGGGARGRAPDCRRAAAAARGRAGARCRVPRLMRSPWPM